MNTMDGPRITPILPSPTTRGRLFRPPKTRLKRAGYPHGKQRSSGVEYKIGWLGCDRRFQRIPQVFGLVPRINSVPRAGQFRLPPGDPFPLLVIRWTSEFRRTRIVCVHSTYRFSGRPASANCCPIRAYPSSMARVR